MTCSHSAPSSKLTVFTSSEMILMCDWFFRSFEAGGVAFDRYAHILRKENPPFIRAAGSRRVVDTAHNWTAGLSRLPLSLSSPSS
jgi:hypothetical protein